MREHFEDASSALVEVNPYRCESRSTGRKDNVSSINSKAIRGSHAVDLMWILKKILSSSHEQNDELRNWMRIEEGMKQNS